MRRVLTAAMAAALALTGAVACGNGTSSRDIVVWGNAGATAPIVKDYLADWSREHGVNVRYEAYPNNKMRDTLPVALKTAQGPDVFAPNNLNGLRRNGLLKPLDGIVSKSVEKEYAEAYAPPSQFSVGGKLYAVPTTASVMGLAYNKDLFRKAGLDPNAPPRTIGELTADAKTITKKVPGAYGFGLPLKWPAVVGFGLEPMIINGDRDLAGHGLYNVSTKHYEFDKYRPVVDAMRDLRTTEALYPGANSLDNDALRSAFAQGKVGMMPAMGPDVALLNKTLKTKQDWDAAPTPVPDGQRLRQGMTHIGSAWAMNENTRNTEGATKVLEALLSTDLQRRLGKAGASYPVAKSVADEKFEPKGQPQYARFAFGANRLNRPEATFPTDDLDVTGTSWRDGVVQLITETDRPVGPTLDQLDAKYEKALAKAVRSKQVELSDYGYPKG